MKLYTNDIAPENIIPLIPNEEGEIKIEIESESREFDNLLKAAAGLGMYKIENVVIKDNTISFIVWHDGYILGLAAWVLTIVPAPSSWWVYDKYLKNKKMLLDIYGRDIDEVIKCARCGHTAWRSESVREGEKWLCPDCYVRREKLRSYSCPCCGRYSSDKYECENCHELVCEECLTRGLCTFCTPCPNCGEYGYTKISCEHCGKRGCCNCLNRCDKCGK